MIPQGMLTLPPGLKHGDKTLVVSTVSDEGYFIVEHYCTWNYEAKTFLQFEARGLLPSTYVGREYYKIRHSVVVFELTRVGTGSIQFIRAGEITDYGAINQAGEVRQCGFREPLNDILHEVAAEYRKVAGI